MPFIPEPTRSAPLMPRKQTVPEKYEPVVAFTEKLTGRTLTDRDYKILITLVEYAGKCDG